MPWKKPLIIGAITLVTLIVAGWAVLWSFDFNRFKPRIAQAVQEASGLELTMHGNIEIGLGPGPRIRIHDVEIKNADWGTLPEMLRMKRCELKLLFLPLIRGVLQIDQLVFVEPDVLIETDASGVINFLSVVKDRRQPEPQSEADAERRPVPLVRAVTLEKGRFTFRDGRRGVTYVKRVERFTLAAQSMRSPVQIYMKGFFNDRPVEILGNLGTPVELMNEQQPCPVDLTAKLDGTAITLKGAIGDVIRFGDFSLKIRAEGSSVTKIFAPPGFQAFADPGPFALTATFTDPEGVPALKDLDLRIGNQEVLEIRVNGSVENLTPLKGIQFHVAASVQDLSRLSRDPAKPLPKSLPLSLAGSVHDSAPKVLSMHDLRITGGKDSLTGSLDMDWSGKKARTVLKVSSPSLEFQETLFPGLGGAILMRFLQGMPAYLNLAISDPLGHAAVEEVNLSLGAPEKTDLRIQGRIQNLRTLQGIELDFSGQGKEASDLGELFGKPIPIIGPYAVSGHVSELSDKGLAFNDLVFTLGKSEVSGLLEFYPAGDRPLLKAVLFSPGLDLRSAASLHKDNRQILGALRALGPVRLAISIADPGGKPAVPSVHVHMGTNELAEVSIKGAVHDFMSRRGIDLEFTMEGREVGNLQEIFRKPLPFAGPFSLGGRFLDSEAGVYRIDDLTATLGENDIRGWLEARIEDAVRIDATLVSQHIDPNVISSLGSTSGTILRHLGQWSLETRLVLPSLDRLQVESFKIAAGTRDFVAVELSGAVHDLFTMRGVEATCSIEGQDFGILEELTGKSFALTGPFALIGRLVDPKAGVYKIQDFNAVFGDNDLEGAFEIILTAPRPLLTADLTSRTLDLRPLFSKIEAGSGATTEGVIPKKSDNGVFPRNRLPLGHLRMIDGEVKLEAGQILLPRLAFDTATVHLKIDSGRLEISPFRGVIGGGSADGSFSLSTEGDTGEATLEFSASQVDLGLMLTELGVQKTVEGKLRSEIEAKSRGDNIGSLMAGLHGRAVFVVADGRIHNKYIDLLGGGLLREVYRLVNPFSQKEPFSELACHVNHFDIQEGVAVSRVWVTDTKHTTVRGAGNIDLGNERLDMAFRMSPKKSIGISGLAEFDLNVGDFAKAFKVEGTFTQPSVTLDPTGAAATIGKMLGGLALFGPLGLAAGLIDLKLGQDHPCLKALEALENGPGTEGDQNGGSSLPPSPLQTLEQHQGH